MVSESLSIPKMKGRRSPVGLATNRTLLQIQISTIVRTYHIAGVKRQLIKKLTCYGARKKSSNRNSSSPRLWAKAVCLLNCKSKSQFKRNRMHQPCATAWHRKVSRKFKGLRRRQTGRLIRFKRTKSRRMSFSKTWMYVNWGYSRVRMELERLSLPMTPASCLFWARVLKWSRRSKGA